MKSNKEYSRRKFIKNLGVGSVSALFGSSYLLSACSSGDGDASQMSETAAETTSPIHTASLQLYTLRNQLAEDIPGTIERIAQIGYKYVETYDFSEDLSFAEVGRILRDNGLAVSSMHSEIPIGEAGERALQRAEAYQNDKVIWHGWPEDERYQTEDGLKSLLKFTMKPASFYNLMDYNLVYTITGGKCGLMIMAHIPLKHSLITSMMISFFK